MDEATRAKLAGSAGWLVGIAACTIINIVFVITNNDTRLVLGAFAVDVAAYIYNKYAGGSSELKMIVTSLMGIVVAGVYFGLSKQAAKGQLWALIVGFVLYAFDMLVCLLAPSWLTIGIHAWALYSLFGGIVACTRMGKNDATKTPEATQGSKDDNSPPEQPTI